MLLDNEIKMLIDDIKPIRTETLKHIDFKTQNNSIHQIWDHELISEKGNMYQIRIRKNNLNRFDFSVILTYVDEQKKLYNLKRYNGKHSHKNKVEKEQFRGFHIHTATQRYQENGHQTEGYAELTNAYATWEEALELMLDDCNFKRDNNSLGSFN